MNETGRETSATAGRSEIWDAEDGVRRAGGNAKLFLRILAQFLDGHADAAQRIRACIDRGEGDVAQRVAHSVKGVAGNIGAARARAAAAAVEDAIKTGAAEKRLEMLIADLSAELSALEAELVTFLARQPREEAADEAPPPDEAAVKAVGEKLLVLLEGSDPGASELVESEKPALRALLGSDDLASFERLVNGYAFDEAAELLRAAAAREREMR